MNNMYYCDLEKDKIILFWNPRCGLSTLRVWSGMFTKKPIPKTPNDPYAKLNEGKKNIIVVRDPVDRFISILNHAVVFHYLGPVNGKGRIELFLDFLEKHGLNINDHLSLQCRFQDKPKAHEKEDIASYFSHIIRLEEGNMIENLNKITGKTTPDIRENILENKLNNPRKDRYDYSKMEVITKDYILNSTISEERIKRIKKLYHYDYSHFYPEKL